LAEGRNLVYSAPTSAGKSMVADILMFRTLFERKKKALVVLPYVSICNEKAQSLKTVLSSAGKIMESFAGNANPSGGLARTDVAICTIEKANNLLNRYSSQGLPRIMLTECLFSICRLIRDDRLSDLGIIIIDELQMLADPNRGYLLELLASEVLFASQRQQQ